MNLIRIGIIDDHQIIINGLRKIIEQYNFTKVVFEATDGNKVLDINLLNKIDVLLLDIEMPIIDGVTLAKKILVFKPNCNIIILTMYNDNSLAKKLREIGVKAYISKNIEERLFMETIKKVHKGNTYFNLNEKTDNIVDDKKLYYKEKLKELSKREKEILALIIKGFSNPEIGNQLFISPRTVDTHRTKLMKKLEVTNVASLVRVALKGNFFTT